MLFYLVILLFAKIIMAAKADWKIIGGVEIDIIKAPWTVSYGDRCGGSILAPKWVITAAHCGRKKFVIVGSAIKMYGTRIKVIKCIKHPHYDKTILDYDYQLVKLKGIIIFNKHTKPIQIANTAVIKPGTWVTVVGWGINENGEHSHNLKSVEVQIQSVQYCKSKLIGTLTNRMICAGNEKGKDACTGDSGGPATVNDKLVGLVSWGVGCGLSGIPGVYSNVPIVKKWIRAVVNI